MKAVRIYADARLKANTEVAVAHFVLVVVRMKKAEVTSDREEEVIIPRRQIRELIFEHLWHGSCVWVSRSNSGLSGFRQDFRRKVTEPGFEQRANDIDVV